MMNSSKLETEYEHRARIRGIQSEYEEAIREGISDYFARGPKPNFIVDSCQGEGDYIRFTIVSFESAIVPHFDIAGQQLAAGADPYQVVRPHVASAMCELRHWCRNPSWDKG